MRAYIFTTPPDLPFVIFIDQITYLGTDEKGCFVRTSDGTAHYFHNVTFEELKKKVFEVSE